MHNLTIRRGTITKIVPFEGTPLLSDVLEANGFGVQRPCGGRGVCGKCAVKVCGCVTAPSETELRAGMRLACQTRLLGNTEVTLPDVRTMEQIELSGSASLHAACPMPGKTGVAVDIGTTTLAAKKYDLYTGKYISEAAMLNPQTSVAADVMGRIGAALNGQLDRLRAQITYAIQSLLDDVGGADSMVVTGNTTMLYLLTGRSPESLSHAPFIADCLFGEASDLLDRVCYLPPCMNAFVGADITCALLSGGICTSDATTLLADIGTNGEIALWKDGELFVTSTAAGPAFEGAGISCGCSSIRGAIDRIWIEDGHLCIHTIGEEPAVGLCGSGLIDAIACALQLGLIDETGAMDDDEIELAPGISLLPRDVRAVQLAKAAIAAGIETLLETAGVSLDKIGELVIAGGFGNHLNAESAAAIGLIPAGLVSRMRSIGNAALTGAAQLLLNRNLIAEAEALAKRAQHVNLGGNPRFNEHYIDQMMFPEE